MDFGLSYFFIMVFLNYLFICLLDKMIKKKAIVWALLGALIFLTSYLNLYWTGTGGGKSSSSNVVMLYKNY
jgi:hypothetical protein